MSAAAVSAAAALIAVDASQTMTRTITSAQQQQLTLPNLSPAAGVLTFLQAVLLLCIVVTALRGLRQ